MQHAVSTFISAANRSQRGPKASGMCHCARWPSPGPEGSILLPLAATGRAAIIVNLNHFLKLCRVLLCGVYYRVSDGLPSPSQVPPNGTRRSPDPPVRGFFFVKAPRSEFQPRASRRGAEIFRTPVERLLLETCTHASN